MNDQGPQVESEFVFRRLTETFKVFGTELDGRYWLIILGAILLVGIAFVVWMYIKDSRTVRWFWAAPLAALRICVYLVLALMFLMPAKQGYERVEKRSRVIVVLDVSDSMAQVSDDPPAARKPVTRLARVMDFLADDKVAFTKAILDKNPVYVYRMGSRLDEEAQLLQKNEAGETVPVHKVARANGGVEPVAGEPWHNDDWQAFAAYDFKPWVLRGLSPEGAARVKATKAWDGNAVGNAEWAMKWHEAQAEAIPADMNPDDSAALTANRDKLLARVDVARSIATATNVPDSLLSLINRETGNMVQGVIVFSDGQSNLGGAGSGSNPAIEDLKVRAKRENIPIFTVAVGSEQKSVNVRITDVQAPDQTPPDEPFKIIVELDGEGLVGQKAQVFLEIELPKGQGTVRIPMEAAYQPGEPPHAQAEFVIDPTSDKLPEILRNKDNLKELVEGTSTDPWRVRAVTPRVEGERFADKEHVSEWVPIKVQKRPARVLVVCSAPSRDVQFLLTQLLRDKADMSLYVQNQGGQKGEINLLEEKERQLTHFPDRINIDAEKAAAEDPATKWYNIAQYDVIIAFDFDWTELTLEQTEMVKSWVDLYAGGLLFVAGHIHTKHLARPDAEDKFRPIIDILPVLPGDPDLAAAKRTANMPWRLDFENLGGDLDFMKLDDSHQRPEMGWELFFTGREEKDEKARVLRGFYNYFPIREMKAVATPIARFPDPNAIKMPDGKAPPWLCVMQYGQGRTAWVGSPEIWRLRQYKDEYFERFWTKFTRYLAAGSRRKQTRRGRILMGREFPVGGYIRLTAHVLDPSLKPADAKTEPKVKFQPHELDKYPVEFDKLQGEELAEARAKHHEKFTYEYRMAAKKETSGEKFQGYFQRAQLASADKFPTGTWRVDVEIPSSTDTLNQKFAIRQSNPELDLTKPDLKALYQIASPVADMQVSDATLASNLQRVSLAGADGKRLAFRFGDDEALTLIPQCFKTDTKVARNRGAVEDYWDKGVTLPSFLSSWMTDKPQKLAYGLMLCVGLLSVEWLIRKLLKLA